MFNKQLNDIKNSSLYKNERIIESPQNSTIKVGNNDVLNFCSNNYLGLSNHPKVIEAAIEGIKKEGHPAVRWSRAGLVDAVRGLYSGLAFADLCRVFPFFCCFGFPTQEGQQVRVLFEEGSDGRMLGPQLCLPYGECLLK